MHGRTDNKLEAEEEEEKEWKKVRGPRGKEILQVFFCPLRFPICRHANLTCSNPENESEVRQEGRSEAEKGEKAFFVRPPSLFQALNRITRSLLASELFCGLECKMNWL